MKKISYMLFLIVMLFVFSISAYASEVIIITGNDVRFRSKPTTSSNYIDSFDEGVELTLLDKNAGTGNGCNGTWYKGQYGSAVGYVCGLFYYFALL